MLFKMVFKSSARQERNLKLLPAESKQDATGKDNDSDAVQQAEGHRLMYERIAQGNALAEAEENARRKWQYK